MELVDMTEVAKRLARVFLLIIIGMIVEGIVVYHLGKAAKEREIKERALQTEEKECYSWQEIEIIIFGEVQL